MKRIGFRSPLVLATALALGLAQFAAAGIVYVSDDDGNVWRYDGIADMDAQDMTTNTGTLVRDASTAGADYAGDQDAVADLSSGFVYRIDGNGNIISYLNVAAYLANSNPLTVGVGVYSGANAINGASYDGNTGGFYSVGSGAAGTTNRGDIQIYNSLATFLAGVPDSVEVANFNGAVLNFFDPDSTPGTTVGNPNPPSPPAPKNVESQYYQVAGNGRLEGFESIADYAETANNRVDITGFDAFGRNGLFQSTGAFAVPIPEPTSLLLCLAAAGGLLAGRRR
jgi:hypothetical protein